MRCAFSKDKSGIACGEPTFLAQRVKVKGGWAIADVCHRHGHYKSHLVEVKVKRRKKEVERK